MTDAKNVFAGIHSARIGLYCGVMFVEFQCYPLEIFGVKNPQFFNIVFYCVTWLMIDTC